MHSTFPVRFACEVKGFDPLHVHGAQGSQARRPVHAVRRRRVGAGDDRRRARRHVDSTIPSASASSSAAASAASRPSRSSTTSTASAGQSKISAFFIPMFIADIAAGLVSMRFNAKGPNYATVSACATSAHAIGDAFRTIQYGDADVDDHRRLRGDRHADGDRRLREHEGAVRAQRLAGDGVASVRRDARRLRHGRRRRHRHPRGARARAKRAARTIYAEIVGYGATGDAYHLTAPAPEGEGAQRAMRRAMKDAGSTPADIDYINAHGTSTPANDLERDEGDQGGLRRRTRKRSTSARPSR